MNSAIPGQAMTVAALVGGMLALAAGAGLSLASRGRQRLAVLACLVVGGGLIALPWLASLSSPDPAGSAAPTELTGLTLSADGTRTIHRPSGQPPPLPGREVAHISIEATEAEPNDTIAGANAAPLGTSILGHAARGDVDTYAFDLPARKRQAVVATLITRDASAAIVLFDDLGRPLGTARTIDEIDVRLASLERILGASRYYVQVIGLSDTPAAYELVLTTKRR